MFRRCGYRMGLVVLLVVAVLVPAHLADAAAVIIDFEDLSRARTGRSFTSFTDRYATRGISFTSGVTAIDYGADSVYQVERFYTHSGVVGIEECFSEEFCSQPIDMAFRSPQYRVKLWAGVTYDPGVLGQNVVLEAFDSSGRKVGEDIQLLRSPYRGGGPVPVNYSLEVVLPTNSITRARFRWQDTRRDMNGLVADDVEFEQGVSAFTVSPNPVDFGQVEMGRSGTRTVTVANTGQVRGSIKQVAVAGGDARDFTVVAGTDSCSSTNLNPGQSCTLDVRFRPGASGTRTSTVVVEGDDRADARLIGEGVAPPSSTSSSSSSSTTSSSTSTTATTTSTTVPGTEVEIPDSTPGSSLTLDRSVGRAGKLVTATGTGFQRGPVTLSWLPGLGTTTTEAGPDGTFTVAVLLLPGDHTLGPRTLVATGSASTATAPFLTVPGRMQPSRQTSVRVVHRR